MRMLTGMLAAVVLSMIVTLPSQAAGIEGKKILYVDSYHEGYVWSDGIAAGIKQALEGTGVDLKIVHMDTKRHSDEASIKQAVADVRQAIESFQPDVVIASDDNASKFVIEPYYKNTALPVVFCGVNWDASVYGFPTSNVTGMVEVDGVKELVDLLGQFAKGSRVAMITDDTETSHANDKNYREKLGIPLKSVFVKSMDEWKQAYTALQESADILVVQNVSGIPDFDPQAAESHALGTAKIPSGAVQGDMMPYAMVGYLKVPAEQGAWSAKAALEIMKGKSPKDIPVAQNKEGEIVVNLKLANAANVEIPYTIVELAAKVIQ